MQEHACRALQCLGCHLTWNWVINSKSCVTTGDLLLFAGDAGLEDEIDVEQFEAFLASQPHPHKVVCYGNMDFIAQGEHGEQLSA